MIDDALLLAHDAAKTCALALVLLEGRLSLPAATATAVLGDANLIATVLAPQVEIVDTVGQIGLVIANDAVAIGTAMAALPNGARDAAPAFYDTATYLTTGLPPTTSPALQRSSALAAALLACGEAAMLAQAFVMEARSRFADRQSALDARSRISSAMDGCTDRIAAAAGADIFGLLAQTARHATDFLIAEASELRPLVQVTAARSFPSTALAWALYGDPARAAELVERNRIGTPLFMPSTFEALAPDGD